MPKTNKAETKSYAEEIQEDFEEYGAEAEAAVQASSASNESSSEDDLVQVGGAEPIAFYYRTATPKKPQKHAFKVLSKGDVITGTFEKAWTGGKFEKTTYIIRGSDGKLFGMPGTGSLKRGMDKLAEGSRVKIIYDGLGEIKGGQYAGRDAHMFSVFGNKLKS